MQQDDTTVRNADAMAQDDIRRSIIRQLGDDPHADRIILQPTDWDIVLGALSPADGDTGVDLRAALEEIAEPIATMQLRASASGSRLDGMMAIRLANDAEYLKGIARRALAALTPTETGEQGK